MGYLKVIESNTTWKCPKTATYEIICVSSGTPDSNTVNNPTSFGNYCTAWGTWPNSSKFNGYTFSSYGLFANNDYKTIGYGSGFNSGLLGKLNISRDIIKKDTEVICTVGKPIAIGASQSNPGVIVIKEIQEESENDAPDAPEAREFSINLYRYEELYKTIKVKEGSSLILPSLPIYCNTAYNSDIKHVGYSTSLGGSKQYNVDQVIYPVFDMDLYAGYTYNYIGDYYTVFNVDVTLEVPGTVSFGTNFLREDQCYCSINGRKVSLGTYQCNVGDVIHTNTINNEEGSHYLSTTYPFPRVGNWRSKL